MKGLKNKCRNITVCRTTGTMEITSRVIFEISITRRTENHKQMLLVPLFFFSLYCNIFKAIWKNDIF